ncbi:MAG: glycosyltransferase family 2 protein, partial [Chitinophagaceae bacterium]
IIIVTYNAAPWLHTCLKGLKDSSLPVETIVIDNHSEDDTLNILRNQYPEVRVIENKVNVGFGGANNQGIQLALSEGADYVFLLNQDASIFPDTLKTLIDASLKHPEYLVISPLHIESSGKKLDYNFSRWVSSGNQFNWLDGTKLTEQPDQDVYTVKFVNAALWLLPKKAFSAVGGFDSLFFHYGEDVDFANRVKYHGFKVGVCPAATGVHYRKQPDLNNLKKHSDQLNKRKGTGYVLLLKNINRSFFYCLLQCINKFFKLAAESVKKRNIKQLALDIKVFIKTFFQLPQIIRHRKISRKNKFAFIQISKTNRNAKSTKFESVTTSLILLLQLLSSDTLRQNTITYTAIIF